MLTLESKLVRIEPLDESSINDVYLQTLNDNEYMKFTRHANHKATHESQVKYIRQFSGFDSAIFKIIDLEDNAFVGTTNFYVNFLKREINFGFLIFRDFNGKGFASDVLSLLVSYCIKAFPRFTLKIGTNSSNLQMRKVAISSGFELDNFATDQELGNISFFLKTPALESDVVPEIPRIIVKAKTLGVVAHDAGGAEQLVWLLKNLRIPTKAFLAGPAIEVFEKHDFEFSLMESLDSLLKCDLVLTGSGWMSSLENDAISACKIAGVPCLTFLDHWVNYKERFAGPPTVSPEMLLVSNAQALAKANLLFPDASTWLLPDFQIEEYRMKIYDSENFKNVIVLLEPSSKFSGEFFIGPEEYRSLIKAAIDLNVRRRLKGVVIRLHPSQDKNSEHVKDLKQLSQDVEFSENRHLIDDLRSASLVIGFSTYALYIASRCGLETYSYFKLERDHWTNTFDDIYPLEVK